MLAPKVSVIVPAYNGAGFLGETIRSVLAQTYAHWELIIVDDASPDDTAKVVAQFDDPRIKYLVHEKNKGSDAARDTGLRASSGAIVAFLDQDDLIHPEKLQAHVAFLEAHPEIGVTYNARFHLNHSSATIREIWRPPKNITLADLVLGFPLAPSDVVLRREWALQMDLMNGSLSWCGGEIIHYGSLFLSGCKFAAIDRALNYRRFHSGRQIRDLAGGCQSEIYAQDKILNDPRCPAQVRARADIAHTNIYLIWAYRALAQNETALGQAFLGSAVRGKPSIVEGAPCELVNFFLTCSLDDDNLDHTTLLKQIFAQLPPELSRLAAQYEWAVARGYAIKGARAVMWDRPADGRRYFEQAVECGAPLDESFVSLVTQYLLDYEIEFGASAAERKLRALSPHFDKLGGRANVRQLVGCYAVNRAFQSYRAGEYCRVAGSIVAAIVNDPTYLANRGVLSIFLRSLFGMWAGTAQAP
jgi:glycosyltransferase involved in cell wall biosynthesis